MEDCRIFAISPESIGSEFFPQQRGHLGILDVAACRLVWYPLNTQSCPPPPGRPARRPRSSRLREPRLAAEAPPFRRLVCKSKPCEFIGFGDRDVAKPYKFIGFGDVHGPTPCKLIRFRCASLIGDLWMWLQLMWLQFEVVRGPAGVVWARFGTGLGSCGPQASPKSTPNDRHRTSDNLKWLSQDLLPHP